MPLQIHQFSLGLKINKNKRGQYVSGGFYGETVDNLSHEVPPEIEQEVKQDLFTIPDGYPPETGQLALIAREVGQYCVLAVANRLDDFMGRNLVGYRYFWLDRQELSPDDDGIATLLFNWYQNNQPCLNLQELQEESSLYTNSWTQQVQNYPKQQFVERYQSLVQHLYSEINGKPTPLFLLKPTSEITCFNLHCLAIEHQHQTEKPISWAWNVRRLSVFDLPDKKSDYASALQRCQSFQLIYCPDEKDVQWLNQQLTKLAPASNKKTDKQNENNPPPPPPQVFPRKLGKLDISWVDVKELADFYQANPNQLNKNNLDADYLNTFNKKDTNHPQYETYVRYVTIFVALAPVILKEEKKRLLNLNKEYKQKAIDHLNTVINLVPKQSADENQYSKFISALKKLLEELEKPSDNHWDLLIKIILPILATVGLSAMSGLYFFLSPSSKEQNGHLGIFGNIISFVRGETPKTKSQGNQAGETTNASNPQTKLAVFLNMYEGIFNAVEIGKKNQLEQSQTFQSLSTALQASRAEIRKIWDDNQQLLTELNSQDPEVVKKTREQDIYKQLKLFTTLNSTEIEKVLPELEEGVQDRLSVAMLQEALKRGGYYLTGQEDTDLEDIFGEATKNAVIQAQTKAGFEQNDIVGRVGQKTWGVLKYRVQDLQVEAVYQMLQTHLTQDNPTSNIVTKIKNCRDKHNKEKTPLHFNDCLENIGTQTTQVNEGGDSGP